MGQDNLQNIGVIIVSKFVMYIDIYTFIIYLKHLVLTDNEYIIIKVFPNCLYGIAYTWYNTELFDIECILIVIITIIVLNEILEKRFRIYPEIIIQNLFADKYNIKDLQKEYILQNFINSILRNAKVVGLSIKYNQLMVI